MTTRVSIAHGGEASSEDLTPSTGGVVRSSDYQGQGAAVRSTAGIGGNRTVSDVSQIADDDIVLVDGMELKASMARELGLLNKAFDDGLSVGAAARAAAAHRETTMEATQPETSADPIAAALNTEVDEGRMSYEEAETNYVAAGELQLAGLSLDEGLEVIEKVRNGETFDLPTDQVHVAQAVEARVTEAASASAKAEIGPDAFAYLQQAAATSQEVNEAIRGFAIRRASGRAEGLTWADLHADVVAHLKG